MIERGLNECLQGFHAVLYILKGSQCFFHKSMVGMVHRGAVQDCQDQQGHTCDPLHGEQKKRLDIEALTAPMRLQPLKILTKHDTVITKG